MCVCLFVCGCRGDGWGSKSLVALKTLRGQGLAGLPRFRPDTRQDDDGDDDEDDDGDDDEGDVDHGLHTASFYETNLVNSFRLMVQRRMHMRPCREPLQGACVYICADPSVTYITYSEIQK